jgi:DNA polymerase-3 subunit epsilon
VTERVRPPPGPPEALAASAPLGEPPAGPPWDLPLQEAPLAFLDLEMTGLEPARDRVVEIAIERVHRGVVEGRLDTLIRPDDGAFGNAHIHGIAEADLAAAPTFAAIAPEVVALLAGAVPIAHGATMDEAFLAMELARAGAAPPPAPFLDTLVLARRAFAAHSHSLASLARKLGLGAARSHRAGDDVATLRALFDRIVGLLAPPTARDLLQVRIGEGTARDLVLARAADAARTGAPVRVTYRPPRRQAEELVMVVTEVRAKLDPPTLLGYLLRCRSRRELRADRVLAIAPMSPPAS